MLIVLSVRRGPEIKFLWENPIIWQADRECICGAQYLFNGGAVWIIVSRYITEYKVGDYRPYHWGGLQLINCLLQYEIT